MNIAQKSTFVLGQRHLLGIEGISREEILGLLDLAGNATLLYYMSEEAKEGKNAYVEKRKPNFSKFPRLP